MRRIGIIGAGAMGSGIGQVAAMAGHEVLIYDLSAQSITIARDSILNSLNKLVAKSKLTDQEAKAIFGCIYFIDHLESLFDCHVIIEAIIEREDEKKKLFARIEDIVEKGTILASNTSSFSITGLASCLKDPSRMIGIHFFNPPVLMKLVEIIPALQTSKEVINETIALISSWEKTTVIAKDTPGFIVNRIARPFYGEALRIAEEKLASPEIIDHAMKELGGFKMGPFELMDFIGNDINDAVTRSVWTAMYYEPRYKPSLLQESMVKAGWLGRKTGRGFYDYNAGNKKDDPTAERNENRNTDLQNIYDRILTMLINEAADALYRGIASRDDIDHAMTLGVNYPRGLLKWADETGIETCVARMDALYDFYKEERYRCSPGLRKKAESKSTYY